MNAEQLRAEAGRCIQAALACSDEAERQELLKRGMELRERADSLEELNGKHVSSPGILEAMKILMTKLKIPRRP